MNIDLHTRTRSVVSGLAAVAITGLLTTTLVESFQPMLWLQQAGPVAADRAAIAEAPGPAAVIRKS